MLPEQTGNHIREHFQEQGYVILKGWIEPTVLDGVRAALNGLVDGIADRLVAAGKIADPLRDEPFDTRLDRLCTSCRDEAPSIFRKELHLAGMYGLFFHDGLLDAAEFLLGGEIRLYPNYSVRPKLPDFEPVRVLWHQDGGYTDIEGNNRGVDSLRMVNVWAPLVPANVRNGCMQFIPGTHRLGVVPHLQKQYYLEIADDHLRPHLHRAIDIELDPGDAVLFHNLLFHQGLPNRADHIRWSADWRYQDATQMTLRKENGHLARSRQTPELAVSGNQDWANRSFG